MKKYIALFLLGSFFIAGISYAAPVSNLVRNILPEANNTYELGTSSPLKTWLEIYTQTASTSALTISGINGSTQCLHADSKGNVTGSGNDCGTGVGGGGTDPFTHPALGQSATTSLMLLFGQASTSELTATSTVWFTSLSNAPLAVDGNGKLISAGSGTSGDCVKWGANNTLADQGAACASGGSVTQINNGGGLDFSVSPITTTGTITAQVGTSTTPTQGNLAYWTGVGTPSTLGTVATSAPTCNNGISCSNVVVLGSSPSITINTNALGLDRLAQIGANTVLGNNTGGTGNITSFATSSLFAGSPGQVLTFTNGTWIGVATSTDSCSSGITCSFSGTQESFSIGNGAITNTMLANSTISGVALGNNLGTLTINSPLTGSSYNGSTGVSIGCQSASGSQAGCLSTGDWTTFNNKIGWGQATSTSANQIVYTNNNGLLVSVASSSLNLPNSALANSSITITPSGNITGSGCNPVSLGATCTLTVPFEWSTGQSNFGLTTVESSTTNSVPLWLKNGFFASSTLTSPSWVDDFVATNSTSTNATTTVLDVSSNFKLGSNALLTSFTGTGLTITSGVLTNSGVISLGNGTGVTCTGTNPGSCSLASISAGQVLGVLGGASAIPSGISTTSLYAATNGQVLTFLNGAWAGAGTTTAGTGLTYNGGSPGNFSVNTSQNIATLSNLTTNGFVTTSGGVGTLGVQTFPCPYTDGCTNSATSWTAGSVFFAGSSAFNQNNSNFFWDNTRVAHGIGTTTPSAILTVASSTAPQLALGDTNSSDNLWTLRSINNNLYFATSTFNATSTVPAITINTNGQVSLGILGSGAVSANSSGQLSSGTLSLANGGTNQTSYAQGNGFVYYDGTRFATNSNFQETQDTAFPAFKVVATGVTQFNGPAMTLVSGNAGGSAQAVFDQQVSNVGGTKGQLVINQQNSAGSFLATLAKFDEDASTTELFTNGSSRFKLDLNGHRMYSGSATTMGTCGTSPSVVSTSNDNAGVIKAGTGSLSSCTINFANAWSAAPSCQVNFDINAATATVLTASTTASAIVIQGSASNMGGSFISYSCTGTY